MENIKILNFTQLSLIEKQMILEWRNFSSIRKWMYNQEEITLKEHLDFIESLNERKDKQYFLVKKDEEYIGVIDFTQIVEKESLHMGIYTNPNLKGNGRILLKEIIDYSFDVLNVKKIYAEVFLENNKAYILYKEFNFKDISTKVVNEKEVICMELTNENR